jgi:hypothetical protein
MTEIGRLRAADLGRREPAANGSAPPAVGATKDSHAR